MDPSSVEELKKLCQIDTTLPPHPLKEERLPDYRGKKSKREIKYVDRGHSAYVNSQERGRP
jgi:hypothetical protein